MTLRWNGKPSDKRKQLHRIKARTEKATVRKAKRGKAESIADQGIPKILWLRNIPHRTVKNNLKGERFEDREVQQGDMR